MLESGLPVVGVVLCVASDRFLTGSLRVPLLECGLRLGSDDGAVAMPAVDGLAKIRGARRPAPLAVQPLFRSKKAQSVLKRVSLK